MTKLLVILLFTTAVSVAGAQKGEWSFAVRGGFGWGGPKTTFKAAMIETGFNQTKSLWLGGASKYPRVRPSFALLLKGGRQIKKNWSLFVMGGLTGDGSVDGFTQQDYATNGWLGFGGGTRVCVNYRIMQVTAGLEHRLPNSSIRIGYGPSVYFFEYSNFFHAGEKAQSVVPGLHVSGTIPLLKEKSRIGVALVTDMALALPVRVQSLHHHYTKDGAPAKVAFVHKTNARMTQGMIGLALTLRS